jgi:hypothetical protein
MTCCAHPKNLEQVHTARQTRFNVWRSAFGAGGGVGTRSCAIRRCMFNKTFQAGRTSADPILEFLASRTCNAGSRGSASPTPNAKRQTPPYPTNRSIWSVDFATALTLPSDGIGCPAFFADSPPRCSTTSGREDWSSSPCCRIWTFC